MKFIKLIILFLALSSMGYAQDIRSNCQTVNCTITSQRAWSSFNQVFIFRPTQAQNSIYFFLVNRNPSSNHTITFDVYQTPANSVADYTNNSMFWTKDSVNGDCSNIQSLKMGTCWVTTSFASQVAIVITNSTSESGSPDEGDLYITQGVGEPKGQGNGQSFSSDPYQQQQQLSQNTFGFNGTVSSPTADTALFLIQTTNTKSVYFNKLTLSTESTSPVVLQLSSTENITAGTCTITAGRNNNLTAPTNLPAPLSAVYTCTTANAMTSNGLINERIIIPPSSTIVLSLNDYYTKKFTSNVYLWVTANVTGNVNFTTSWSEQ